jgi:hypothetical protein
MFHFPTFPPHALCVQARVTPHDWCGVPPFGNPRINARLTAPRGLSQPPTSFIGSWCQGIHRAPLKTWPHKNPAHHPRKEAMQRAYKNSCYRVRRCSRPLCSSQRTTSHPLPAPASHAAPAGARRYKSQGALSEITPPPGSPDRPAPSGPNSVPTNRPSPVTTFHTPRGRTSSGRRCRPNWSVFHPRAPPRTLRGHPRLDDRRGPGAALDHQNESGGQCSLERR